MNHFFGYLILLLVSLSAPSLANFTDNLRWSVDNSVRLNINNTSNMDSRNYFIGIDTHKVFNDQKKDVGYSVIQLYYTKLSNQVPFPFMFRHSDDEQFIIREVHYNFLSNLNSLMPNLRVGHFTLPFGLEDSQDTNGRLLDYGHGKNLGTKLDWGLLANKVHKHFEYKLSYSLGGKDDLKSNNGSYIVSARISTLSHLDFNFGLSVYKAKLDSQERERVAFDMKYHIYQWTIKNELAFANTANNDSHYWLFELNRLNLNEQWKVYLQYIFEDNQHQMQSEQKLVLGTRYTPNNHWDFSMQLKQQFQHPENKNELELLQAQLRYRF